MKNFEVGGKKIVFFLKDFYLNTLLAALMDKVIIQHQRTRKYLLKFYNIFYSCKKIVDFKYFSFSGKSLKNGKWKTENCSGPMENGKQKMEKKSLF